MRRRGNDNILRIAAEMEVQRMEFYYDDDDDDNSFISIICIFPKV